ncbi:quinolinate synthase NadA [Bathymodiolus septemdierum thioautotrophic gill symbiont]|uniref:Quinolinate synthase n=1 Tax=endosymbiont of Bathymodiolus septemdierum str. Myojin knoll TaxID=1303921 RepID=A0A0P0USU3_9GAMM|nr:quinolinate synthase NadA [Bathymodiolus septemdierum thioautotrophic gill symbiont]BAS67982.1 quinolinate synthase [endosymbiont of Bathymodiolus septemdierum str. Myojin knoll]
MSIQDQIKAKLKDKNAVLVAHYYVSGELQTLAEETGGIVSDSLEMARFGQNCDADIIIVAGVKFMGETAKILSPEKTVLVLDDKATCSLDEDCPIDEFSKFCDQHTDRTVVVYANTSAAVKARADWVVTSGSALTVVKHLHEKGEKILWAPDKHLGNFVQNQTGADMLLWQGSCVVHERFKADALLTLKEKHPQAAVLVHPESPQAVVDLADIIGSTTALINAVRDRKESTFIIATDNGIFHKMREVAPNKILIEAPTMGVGADCESCAHCEWMAMNDLENCLNAIQNKTHEITIEESVAIQAKKSIQKLLDFTA